MTPDIGCCIGLIAAICASPIWSHTARLTALRVAPSIDDATWGEAVRWLRATGRRPVNGATGQYVGEDLDLGDWPAVLTRGGE